MVYSMDPLSPKQDRLIYATVLLYLCAVLLSLWSSLLLLCSCLRLSHPGSRTLVRRDGRVCPIFQLLYSATLTRMVQALAMWVCSFVGEEGHH